MTQATRRAILAVVTGTVLLALGFGAAVVVGDALGIRTESAAQTQPAAPVVPTVADAAAPPSISSLDVPTTERVGVAVDELLDAVADMPERVGEAGPTRPEAPGDAPAAPGGSVGTVTAVQASDALDDAAADGYTLEGDASALRIVAGSVTATVRAIYDLAAHDTLRLLAAYRAMILHQREWHDTLSPDAHAARDADRVEFEALAAEHLDRYEGDLDHPTFNLTAAQLGVERAERDLTMAWLARVLLVLAGAWLLIGMLAARTRLVRRPGAAAARASWIASTRPWRARESTLGMLELDRWLLLAVPAALLVATRAVQTSFLSWTHLAVVFGAWAMFVLVVRACVGRRSPWPVLAAVGGVVVLRCLLTLFAVAFTGPGGYWFAFWTDPVLRTAYIALAFALFVWVFVAAGWALSAQVGARRATGYVLAGVGAGLAVPAAVVGAIGLETVLTRWNDEMGLLPWGLARILGITTYLEIPASTAWVAAGAGAVVLVVGVLLAVPWRRRGAAAS